MNREEYVKRAWNVCAIKVCGAVEDQHDDMWDKIEMHIRDAITEAYNKGHDEGYREAMNEASYEYDRKMGYL